MEYDDVLTRNDEGELAVRTVSATEQSTVVNPNDVYTRDTDGNLCIRTTGGGSGDQHNLGYFATQSALEEAYPTAEAGDWAIVGSTDTVWIWDTDTSAWVDSDQKGQVTSVNNQTGDITIKTINNNELVGSGNIELSTYLTYPNTWTTNSTTKAFCDIVAADTTATVGKAYLGEVTFSDLPASMVNGEVVVEIMSGTTSANKVIVLSLKSGNVSPYAWQYVYWNGGIDTSGWKTFGDTLPSQTGNSGKFLTTDGTNTSWSDKPLVNKDTSNTYGLSIGMDNNTSAAYCVAVGTDITVVGGSAVQVGRQTKTSSRSIAIGNTAEANSGSGLQDHSIAIGVSAKTTASGAIQLGGSRTNVTATNSDANTFKVANENGNFEIMSANGTIPADRLVNSINKYSTMPTASADNLGWVIQYTGTTDSNYTHNYIYECVSDGGNPATYSWTAVQVQAGGSSLPSQTGNSGKFLTTDGTDASWSDKPLVNNGTGTGNLNICGSTASASIEKTGSVAIGFGTETKGTYSTAIGYNCTVGNNKNYSVSVGASAYSGGVGGVALGAYANALANCAIQIGSSGSSTSLNNSDANTFKVGNANGNFEMMSADGTIPTARLTKVNTTITLASADWSSNSQTVNVTGMTATGIVMVSPDPTDQSAYTSAGIICSAQGSGTLTFTCDTAPSADIDVVVVML